MDVRYSDAIRNNPAIFERLRPFAAQLERVVGPKSSPEVKAEWEAARDETGREVYRLSLEDPAGRASAEFAPDDLAMPLYMRSTLFGVWGDILQIRSDIAHERVLRLLADYPGEEQESNAGDSN